MTIVVCNMRALARSLAQERARKRQQGSGGVRVRLGSAVPDKCLICQGSVLVGGRIVMCPYCGSVYHLECLRMALESSGVPLEEATCFYCGRKMPVAEVLRLAER